MKKMPIAKIEPKNEIVVYQPDEVMRLEVRVLDESVWLTQAQIAELFGTKRPAITKHLTNIYKAGELERDGTCSILEHMGHEVCGSIGRRITISMQFLRSDIV